MGKPPFKVRCSSISKLMTEPKSIDPALIDEEIAAIIARTKRTPEEKARLQALKDGTLSETAKSHVRELLAQDLYGVDFEIGSRPITKGKQCEQDGIDLLNRVRGLQLVKNTERRENDYISGECDLFYAPALRLHDIKCAWSVQTFPIVMCEAEKDVYEWQMRGYLWLWDAESAEVNYVLVNTPAELIGFEAPELHAVDHVPERMRLTSWTVTRDRSLEPLIATKVELARAYYQQALAEFERLHAEHPQGDAPMAAAPVPAPRPAPAPAPAPVAAAPKPAAVPMPAPELDPFMA